MFALVLCGCDGLEIESYSEFKESREATSEVTTEYRYTDDYNANYVIQSYNDLYDNQITVDMISFKNNGVPVTDINMGDYIFTISETDGSPSYNLTNTNEVNKTEGFPFLEESGRFIKAVFPSFSDDKIKNDIIDVLSKNLNDEADYRGYVIVSDEYKDYYISVRYTDGKYCLSIYNYHD